jgi:hypothetical protein
MFTVCLVVEDKLSVMQNLFSYVMLCIVCIACIVFKHLIEQNSANYINNIFDDIF